MADTKNAFTVKDSTTFIIHESELAEQKVAEHLETPDRNILHSDGLKWKIRWYAAGYNEDSAGHISIFLMSNKNVRRRMSVVIDGSLIKAFTVFDSTSSKGWPKYAKHSALRPLFRGGKLTVTCSIEFEFLVPFLYKTPRLADGCGHVEFDVELVMENGNVGAHKSFLSLMSPVFHAIFSNNSAESKSGTVEITDFEFETVKAAIDLCYGREVPDNSIKMVIKILRFAHKYEIKAVTTQLESIPRLNLSALNFCAIAQYAYDCSKDNLFTECCNFFKKHQTLSSMHFFHLPPTLAVDMLKRAFGLETRFDVLRHAHKHEYNLVMSHLEQPLLKSLSLKDICPAISYAWDCSRDELQKKCAVFYNDNQAEVSNLQEFINLPPKIVHGVLKLRFELRHS
uniref:BTB domain-containing protein n=1 Tax=Panagrellus redivivus TaxID=6233 RepID=A0A7E4ULZ3_PANRE